MEVQACRATRVTGQQSDTMLDLRQRCLGTRRIEVDEAVAALLGSTDVATLERAVDATASLDPLDGCADTAALAQAMPPPADPAARAEAERIEREAEAVRARERAGHGDGLVARAAALVAQARALGHPPALAAALAAQADVQLATGDYLAGSASLRELIKVAAAAHDDRASAVAWSDLVVVEGFDLGKPDEAVQVLAAAEAAVVRAGSPLDLHAQVLWRGAQLDSARNQPEAALARLAEARRMLEAAGATRAGSLLGPELGDVLLETADTRSQTPDGEAAVAAYREAIAFYRRVHGPDHPDEAYAWNNLSDLLRIQGRPAEAVDAAREAVRIRAARQSDTPLLLGTQVTLATALEDAGRWDEARSILGDAVRLARARLAPDDLQRVPPLIALARVYGHARRWDEKSALEDEVLALYARTHARTVNLPITLLNRGNTEVARGHRAEALAFYDRSIARYDEIAGATSYRLIMPLEAKGRVLVGLGRPAEALAPLARALALHAPGRGRREQASARFYHGRALVDSGRDRAGGLREARAGRAALAALDPKDPELAAADAWLAGRASASPARRPVSASRPGCPRSPR